jgi:glycosyltransferase involved in cell wall biosynthesis
MKIYFCTTENANNYRSWSNIPYLIKNKLQEKGYCVKNIILYELQPIKFLFNILIRGINRQSKNKTTFFYNRTYLHYLLTYIYSLYIKIVAHKNDLVLIQGFTHPPIIFYNKTILLGDWPYRYIFQNFLKGVPSSFERHAIMREDRLIERANIVITLFPDVHDFMLSNYQNKNIFFLGNFVNVDFSFDPLPITFKKSSNRILFIGRSQYIDSAFELVEAINRLRLLGEEINLDIVGITKAEMPINYDWVKIYGYLDKGVPDQKKKFYELLKNARVIANTTKNWNGFQALLEGMYFSNPMLIRDNPNINKFFDNLDDISYIVNDNPDSLCDKIKEVFDEKHYSFKASCARKVSEQHTCGHFVEKLLALINEK